VLARKLKPLERNLIFFRGRVTKVRSPVYLSPSEQSNWGPDQFGSSVIAAGGGSVTISVACNGASIKVIREDQKGCFVYQVLECGDTATWTITNDGVPDCGN
jgi:hypothetical protein